MHGEVADEEAGSLRLIMIIIRMTIKMVKMMMMMMIRMIDMVLL